MNSLQTSGKLAFVRTASGEVLFLRAPLDRDNYTPAICFEKGYLFASYVLLRDVVLAESGFNVIEPRLSPALLRTSKDRWICGFLAALDLMETVWQATKEATSSRTIEMQHDLATTLRDFPPGGDAILKKTGKRNQPDFPRSMESYVKTLLIQIYWGRLWRIRNPKRMPDGTFKCDGWNYSACAAQLNKLRRILFPKWEAWGWSDFTARMVRDVADDQGELERKLPDGRRG